MERFNRLLRVAMVLVGVGVLGGCQEGLREDRDRLWQANQEYQQELTNARQALEAAEAQRDRLQSEVNRLQAERQTAVAVQPAARANTGFDAIEGVETLTSAGRITVRVPGDVLFASGSVELKSTSQKTLKQIADVVKRDYQGKIIRIAGYTDADPIRKSKWSDNLELSLQRAAAVHRFLQKEGVDPKQMYAAGYGQWQPQASKEKSRRVEIVVELY